MTTAIYARISEDDRKTELGVERQRDDALDLVQRRGWEVFKTYTDNDIGAFKGDKLRPAYQQMLSDARAGRFDRIIVYSQSRLWRNRAERGHDIDLLGKLGVTLTLANGEERNLATASGRRWADMMGTSDSAESDEKSERVRDAARQRANQGRANSFVLYGWKRIYTSISPKVFHDEEDEIAASAVRELVDRLLAGESTYSIIKDFNERGVTAPRGKEWNVSQARRIATRPANVAQRVAAGKVVADAAWAPIVDADKHERVVALISKRKQTRTREGRRWHLLTFGYGECGVCGGMLSARTMPPAADGERYYAYRCDKHWCVSRNMPLVDVVAGRKIVRLLAELNVAAMLAGDDQSALAAQERVKALSARLDNAADAYAAQEITREQLARISTTLRSELQSAEAEVQRLTPSVVPTAAYQLNGPDAAEVWGTLDVEGRRAVMQALGIKVIIMKRAKTGAGLNEDEIVVRLSKAS